MMKKILLLCLLLWGYCPIAQAFTLEHEFTVFIGPFNASQTRFAYSLAPDSYSVNSSVRTAGMFNTLYPFKANYSTTGKIVDNNLITSSYHYDSQSRFNKRTKELVYNNQGLPVYRLSTKNDRQKKVNLDIDLNNRDTTDLQTVFAELAKQYNELKFCDSRLQVFDGKRRFDVIFKDEGREELKANKYSPFSGTATKCSMYIDKLGAKGDDLLWDLSSDRPIYFWLLEEPQQHKPFIAKITIDDTPLGRLEVYTAKITLKD